MHKDIHTDNWDDRLDCLQLRLKYAYTKEVTNHDHVLQTCIQDDKYTTHIACFGYFSRHLSNHSNRRVSMPVLLWKSLRLVTYSCINLYEVATKVEELILALRKKLPKSEGIILRPEAKKAARKEHKKSAESINLYHEVLREVVLEMTGDTRTMLKRKLMNLERY